MNLQISFIGFHVLDKLKSMLRIRQRFEPQKGIYKGKFTLEVDWKEM